MFRKLVAVCVMSAALAGAGTVAVQARQAPGPTAEAFGNSLVAAINNAIAANAAATPADLQKAIEAAIEATFAASGASPEAAIGGVVQSKAALTRTGALCAIPPGPPTKACEAVALAFKLAESATNSTATGAIGGGGSTPVPTTTGGGGGGGGVTHPPVTN